MSAVYEARADGAARPDGEETTATRWFTADELRTAELGPFARTTLTELGLL